MIGSCLTWSVASCGGGGEDEVAGHGDDSGGELETSSLSQETTCSPVMNLFPVNARHNTGFDWSSCTSTFCSLYCPPQAQTVSTSDYHGGIDIFADPGAPVVAAQAGTINTSFSDNTGGTVVYVRDACGWNHYYAHLATRTASLTLGQFVPAGTVIGTVGNTGNAAGKQHHLHYGIYNETWTPTNPFSLLNAVEGTSCNGGGGGGCTASVPAGSWTGQYWNNTAFSGNPVLTRDDGAGALGFNWGTGSPGAGCGVPVDNFAARWTRTLSLAAGTYRFTTTTDDGVRLYVDGALRIDRWIDQGPTTYTADVALGAGSHAIRLDYYERGGGAAAALSWAVVSAPPNPTCGSNCTQCVLNLRTDILPFYQQNGWDTSCGNRDAILTNWCGIDPGGCASAKASPSCQASCIPAGSCGNACTACVLQQRPDILPFYQQNGWDTSCGNRNAIIANWCSIDPAGCSAVRTGACRSSCGL